MRQIEHVASFPPAMRARPRHAVHAAADALGVSWPPTGLPLHCLLWRFAEVKVDGVEVRYSLNWDLVRMLVEANPNALTNQDNQLRHTPLLCACEKDYLSMEVVLIRTFPS